MIWICVWAFVIIGLDITDKAEVCRFETTIAHYFYVLQLLMNFNRAHLRWYRRFELEQ